jgi:hypothetical protein
VRRASAPVVAKKSKPSKQRARSVAKMTRKAARPARRAVTARRA